VLIKTIDQVSNSLVDRYKSTAASKQEAAHVFPFFPARRSLSIFFILDDTVENLLDFVALSLKKTSDRSSSK